jgi:hypothetical protein
MQSLTWYVRRLGRMSPGEIAWRGRIAVRGVADQARFALGNFPSLQGPIVGHVRAAVPRLSPVEPGGWRDAPAASAIAQWRDRLIASADEIANHRFTFFNLSGVDVGNPVDWNRDHETNTSSPRGFAGSIDYRDVAAVGDAKLVWEPSRHLQLPVLARAWLATGESRYISAAWELIESWMTQCPFGDGMQWRSPLEVAIRAINWSWFLALAAGGLDVVQQDRLRHALALHVEEVARKYSHGSSANNHSIGEAAAVFVTTSIVADLPRAAERRDESRRILEREIVRQHHADGGNAEQAFGYHLFVLHFLVVAGFVARRTGQSLSEEFWTRLSGSIDFADALLAAGPAVLYGDADEGYVLDLGDRDAGGREIVAIGRSVLEDRATAAFEPVAWLYGSAPSNVAAATVELVPRAFPETGLYLLQWGREGALDCASLSVDCGELGFGTLAAHGHADALSMTLRAFGEDVIVDPGTYDYFRYPAWREYFRSTRAHNTVVVDGADQSQMLGPFMWGERASARCLEWRVGPGHAFVAAEHDGYRRLSDPVVHRRQVTMDAASRTFTIEDSLDMGGAHDVELRFHVSERARVTRSDSHEVTISVTGGEAVLSLDPALDVTTINAPDEPIGGWVSRGYHRRSASVTIAASCRAAGRARFRTTIVLRPGHTR